MGAVDTDLDLSVVEDLEIEIECDNPRHMKDIPPAAYIYWLTCGCCPMICEECHKNQQENMHDNMKMFVCFEAHLTAPIRWEKL